MSIGDAFAFIQLNTPQASILSKYFQRLCGFRCLGSASTAHAVTYMLGNSSPFRLYCSALHPKRKLWRDQSLRDGANHDGLTRLHAWMAASSLELESK
jgi:hypothetical protein